METTKLKPIGKNILIEPIDQKISKVGIIIPQNATKEQAHRGFVVAVPEITKEFKADVKVGDEVLFKKYRADEIVVDNKKYLLLDQSNILGVLND